MPYCSNFDSQIVAGSKFCSNCGARATPQPPGTMLAPAPLQPQPNKENPSKPISSNVNTVFP